ncbi:MAG: NADH-quinone oxidoreductase subunit M, partial [Sulfurimicrobium sp.]|nr:NADH-quinone oxidoreductase subunit M [Sulfurimicrobium sp.]
MSEGSTLLSWVIWLPIVAGLLVLATGSDRNAQFARIIALIGASANFLVSIPLFTGFNRLTS